jgi:hypothetical protein
MFAHVTDGKKAYEALCILRQDICARVKTHVRKPTTWEPEQVPAAKLNLQNVQNNEQGQKISRTM